MGVLTPKFRVSYPNVFNARENEMSGKMEYSVVALFDKGTDLSELRKVAKEAVIKKWGADEKKWPKTLKSPFRDQGEREKEDGTMPEGYVEGAKFLNLKATRRPGLVDQELNDIIDETKFYGGCYARAEVNAYAYDMKGNKGVAFGLNNLQKVADGDPFGNRTPASEAFSPIEEVEEGTQPTDPTSIFG